MRGTLKLMSLRLINEKTPLFNLCSSSLWVPGPDLACNEFIYRIHLINNSGPIWYSGSCARAGFVPWWLNSYTQKKLWRIRSFLLPPHPWQRLSRCLTFLVIYMSFMRWILPYGGLLVPQIGTDYVAILQGNNNGQNILNAFQEKGEAIGVIEHLTE